MEYKSIKSNKNIQKWKDNYLDKLAIQESDGKDMIMKTN